MSAVLLTVACSKTDSAKSGGGNGPGLPIAALDDRPTGVFTPTGNPSNGQISARFTGPACLAGKEFGANEIEDRYRVGDRIESTIQISSEVSVTSASSVETIQSVSPTSLVAQMDYSNISSTNATGELPSQLTMTKTCTVTQNTQSGAVQKTTSCAETPTLNVKVPSQNCTIESHGKDQYSEVEGTYRLASGVGVRAYKITTTSVGEMKCQIDEGAMISKGQGKQVLIEIVSNDVLAADMKECGGGSLFMYSLYTTADGKAVTSFRRDLTSAPGVR